MDRAAARPSDPPDLGELAGRDLGERVVRYDERDAILYALAIGARESDLDLIYERRLRVLPTFVLTLGLWAVEAAAEVGGYDRSNTLHVGQEMTVRRALPSRGEIKSRASIESVWDKGSAALLVVRVAAERFDARYTIFLPGLGGFGGERGTKGGVEPPSRAPDFNAAVRTTRNQAALYRLTGDLHPLHVDPAVAAAAGFARPILHGLATLGAVILAIAPAVHRRPWDLAEVGVRFGAPVTPGDTIDVAGWNVGERVVFTAAVGADDVLEAGSARFEAGFA